MNGRGRFGWIGALVALAVAGLIGWGCVIGAREVLHGLDIGVLNNRKGPDVDLARRPMMFWSLIVFYATAILISAGMAILLAGIALKRLFGRGG